MNIPGTGLPHLNMTPLSTGQAGATSANGSNQAFTEISDQGVGNLESGVPRQPSDLPAPDLTRSAPGAAANALSSLLPQDATTDIYAVMALFQKLAQEQRTAAREVRHNEMQAQVSTLQSAADEIRNAAKDRLVGAIVSGVMQIGAGAMQIGGATMSLKASAGALKDFRTSQKPPMEIEMQDLSGGKPTQPAHTPMSTAELGNLTQQASAYSSGADGASKVATGIGGMASGIAEFSAAQHDADKARLEAKAKAHEAATQQAGDVMQQMMDVIRDVRDKLNAMEQSRSETTRGIARNI